MNLTNLDTKPKPNIKQQECIDFIDGSIMVLAGPGTGKTFTVIERIKNMLLHGIEASKILCLTFSEAAATEMKKRLLDKMGQEASGVNIYTYHSFCFEIIQNNPDLFEQYSGFQIINDTVKKSLIRQCIEELGYITDHYQIADGSGVSLYNYISTDLLLGFLIHAYDNKAIFDILYEALPIAGVDGTLSNRMKKTKAFRRVRAKTGTVTGISSLAGYAKASNGHLLAFVIINQNVLKYVSARKFQDEICNILASYN